MANNDKSIIGAFTVTLNASAREFTAIDKTPMKTSVPELNQNDKLEQEIKSDQSPAEQGSGRKDTTSSWKDIKDFSKDFLGSPYLSPSAIHRVMKAQNLSFAEAEQKVIKLTKASSASGQEPLDCSGFAQKVLAYGGVSLPADITADQMFTHVSATGTKLDSPQEGALIFFEPVAKVSSEKDHWAAGRKITHVGFYAGNGKILDSSSGAGGVKERPFTKSAEYKYHYVMPNYKFSI